MSSLLASPVWITQQKFVIAGAQCLRHSKGSSYFSRDAGGQFERSLLLCALCWLSYSLICCKKGKVSGVSSRDCWDERRDSSEHNDGL